MHGFGWPAYPSVRLPYFNSTSKILRVASAKRVPIGAHAVRQRYTTTAGADDIDYVYDEAGRLVQATNRTAGESVRYTYDAVGNITSQVSGSVSTLAIVHFSPRRGPIGTQVTINGTGFSATPASNTVRFNGVAATVVSATQTRIVATVAASASSGSVSVEVASVTATSTESFVVTATGDGPSISVVLPNVSQAGNIVTIVGVNFEPVPTQNRVRFANGTAEVLAATETALTVRVPVDAGSGKIKVTTPRGIAVSPADFIVVPAGNAPSGLATVERIDTDGTASNVNIVNHFTYGMRMFEGKVGDLLTIGMSGMTFPGATVRVHGPDNAVVASGSLTPTVSGLQVPKLTVEGTYSVYVFPSYIGSGNLAVYKPSTTSLTLGTPTPVTITPTGRRALFTFTVPADTYADVTLSGVTLSAGTLTLTAPGGGVVKSQTFNTTGISIQPYLKQAGQYTLLIDPNGSIGGNAEIYDYDGMGNLISMTDRREQLTSYTYDALDRLKTITHADGSTITLVWDAGDRLSQIVDSANGTVTSDYDNLNRLVREISPQGQVDYEYDDAGRRTRLTVAGRAPITYEYDDANRVSRIAQSGVAVDLTYDAANRRETVTWPNGIVGTFAFDDADQLLSMVYDKGATRIGEVEYTYDLAGRRIGQSGGLAKLTMPASLSTATYDAANRLTQWGAESLLYDDNGNLISRGATSYGWNARDELISTSSGMSSFAYDAFGRRTSRTVAGTTVPYLYDGMNPVLVNNDVMLAGFGLDEFFAAISSSGGKSHIADALGSTRLLTDDNGNTVASYGYTPYGEASRSGSADALFQFTGRENDGASGLFYYRARYYEPEFGRFIQSDPIGLAGGINTYGYVGADPISFIDPERLEGYGPWNNTPDFTNPALPPEEYACGLGAAVDSLLNITPFVGVAKAFMEDDDPSSLDVVSAGSGTTIVITEGVAHYGDKKDNARLEKLRKRGTNRRERTRLENGIGARKEVRKIFRAGGRIFGIFGAAVEAQNFAEAMKECVCGGK